MLTTTQLARLVGPDRARQWHAGITGMLRAAEATTPLRAAHMLAQVLHETAGLRVTTENLNYSAERLQAVWPSRFTPETAASMARQPERIANHVYANRMGNGPPESGDGWRYRGRGTIQLTGKSNYAQYQAASGAPVVAYPELVERPQDAALAAAWYWVSRGINARADRDDLESVTRAVNGGLNGLADRRRWLEAAKRALASDLTPAPEPAPTEQPERVGDFEVIVLHDVRPSDALRISHAVINGDRSIPLGAVVVSRTGGRKVDVRFL